MTSITNNSHKPLLFGTAYSVHPDKASSELGALCSVLNKPESDHWACDQAGTCPKIVDSFQNRDADYQANPKASYFTIEFPSSGLSNGEKKEKAYIFLTGQDADDFKRSNTPEITKSELAEKALENPTRIKLHTTPVTGFSLPKISDVEFLETTGGHC